MVRRIGIVYNCSDDWIGGRNYLINFILTLSKTESLITNEIYVIHNKNADLIELRNMCFENLNYIELNYKLSFPKRILNKICLFFSNKLFFKYVNPELDRLDFIFPGSDDIVFQDLNKIYWIPDFQERHLQSNFSEYEILVRNNYQEKCSKSKYIILSSDDVKADYLRFFPNGKARVFVHKFCSFLDLEKSKQKRFEDSKGDNYPHRFFLVSNQFWRHKNHEVVVEAMAQIVNEGNVNIKMIFTGSPKGLESNNYYEYIRELVSNYNLNDFIDFTGIISRSDLLGLMLNAEAIIQPSKFEGWSTIIEDSLALGKIVLASNINVNVEQLAGRGLFFDTNNPLQLVDLMYKVMNGYQVVDFREEYELRRNNCIRNLENIVNQIDFN